MLSETMFWNSVDRNNRIFKSFDTRKCIIKKELKYFSYDFKKKTTNLGKLYLYLKFISGFIMYPEDPVPRSPTVDLQQRKHQNFLIFI